MGPGDLAQVLRPLSDLFKPEDYPALLVGLGLADDAAVYRLNDEVAIIVTTDFFPPVLDDPYAYGAVAAANAMSDVYAMGGEVLFALNIVAFPANLPHHILSEILRGGADKVAEAGGVIAGGHTLNDREPKYGLAVTGIVHPERIVTKAGAKPGDILVLTKPLGTGLITTALKGEAAKPAHVRGAVESMMTLNRRASQLMQRAGVHAATDITGFALLGHAHEMAENSGVGLRFHLERIPLLEGAKHYAGEWLFPGGAHTNRDHYSPWVHFAPGISEEDQLLLYDPQTSGGLLIALPGDKLERFLSLCEREGQSAWVVGEVVGGQGIEVMKSD